MAATPQQRSSAARASETRTRRAELKRQIREGLLDPYEVICGNRSDWEPWIAGMRIRELLLAVRGVGDKIATDVLFEARIGNPAATKLRVGELSYAHRDEIAATLKLALESWLETQDRAWKQERELAAQRRREADEQAKERAAGMQNPYAEPTDGD